jgi:hypothetical protein
MGHALAFASLGMHHASKHIPLARFSGDKQAFDNRGGQAGNVAMARGTTDRKFKLYGKVAIYSHGYMYFPK